LTTDAFEKAVALCQRRAGWRRQIAGREGVGRERASVDAKIAMLDSALRRAQELHEASLSPLRELRERLADRAREAGSALEDLRTDLPKHFAAARESARLAFLAASAPLAKETARREAAMVEAALIEKTLAEKPVTSSERPASKAWLAARADRDFELTERLASLRAKAENAAAKIAELAPLAAEAKAKLDAAEQSAYDF